MEITRSTEYDRLLARHHAARLRRQILGAGTTARSGPGVEPRAGAQWSASGYDGRDDQQVILRNLELVLPFDRLVGELYDSVFRARPQLRALFPVSMEPQRENLARMLRYLIENLHRPEHMSAVLRQLGRDHRELGVQPAHYDAFEEALRDTLRTRAGQAWSAPAEQAWLRMLRFAAGAMTAGAESATSEAHERR